MVHPEFGKSRLLPEVVLSETDPGTDKNDFQNVLELFCFLIILCQQ